MQIVFFPLDENAMSHQFQRSAPWRLLIEQLDPSATAAANISLKRLTTQIDDRVSAKAKPVE